MKPANFNQLLFHPKTDCLTFYTTPLKELSALEALTLFLDDMHAQLILQNKTDLALLFEKERSQIMTIIKNHPDKSHGFYFSHELKGYIILDQTIEPYCVIGKSFHVRPLIEGLFENPEYMVVNVSLYDIKIYRGDFEHLEIIQHYEFDQLSKNFLGENATRLYTPQYLGLIPFKTIAAIKSIAQRIMDLVLYHSMPVIVTGLADIKAIFLRYFESSFGVISHIQEDFYEKTCMEILERCKNFRYMIMDFYSAQFKERLKRLVKSKRLISDMGDIIQSVYSSKVVHLILPTEKKIWGKINPTTREFTIHKKPLKNSVDILNELAEEVMRQGGRIQILGPHFFPQEASVLAILRG